MSAPILVIDDNEGVRDALALLFEVHDLNCVTASSPEEGLKLLDQHAIGVVVQDMNFTGDTTSGREGVRLFKQIREHSPDLPVILLTAWTHLETAVELVREGAADYLAKPWDDEKLVATTRNLLELGELSASDRYVRSERLERRKDLESKFNLCDTVFSSTAMQEVITVATRIARSDVPVLITGPNGAGKEKIAEIVHANSSVADGPHIRVNVGALPASLIESELFGAEAGAFTGASNKPRPGHFESADGGTLFLDEIGTLSLDGQAKLLRVLQTGEFQRLGSSKTRRAKVRVVSATNADLPTEVAAGRFREDLYYRLNVVELQVPPLVQRKDDILPLAYHFLGSGKQLDSAAEQALVEHVWPGNVRELQNTIKRASLLASADTIFAASLGLDSTSTKRQVARPAEPDGPAILAALQRADGVVARAARDLGLSRQALYRRMAKHGIQTD